MSLRKKNNDNVEGALMEKLQNDVATDEVTHKLEGKATKNEKTEKKEFRRKVIDYVLEKLPGLQSRSRRAGLVHNFLRGLGINGPQGAYDLFDIRYIFQTFCLSQVDTEKLQTVQVFSVVVRKNYSKYNEIQVITLSSSAAVAR